MSSWGAVRLSLGIVTALVGCLLMLASIPAVYAVAGIDASVGKSGVVAEPLGTLRAAEQDRAVIVDEVSARLVLPSVHPLLEQALALGGTDPATLAEEIGTAVLVVASDTDAGVFIGVGPVDDVNDYLAGVPYSVAVSQDGAWPTVSVPGDRTPMAPEDVDIWSASATGLAPELPTADLTGTTLVVMRSDVDPGVETSLRLEYRVPGAGMALQAAAVSAAGLSLGGLLLTLLGGWLVVGRRRAAEALT
jgi:hypothetical protein